MFEKQHRSKKEKGSANRKNTGKLYGNKAKVMQENTALLKNFVY